MGVTAEGTSTLNASELESKVFLDLFHYLMRTAFRLNSVCCLYFVNIQYIGENFRFRLRLSSVLTFLKRAISKMDVVITYS